MSLYSERMKSVFSSMERGANSAELKRNRQRLVDDRQGDYLIKSTEKDICLMGIGYIYMAFRDDGWMVTGTRKHAQWFHREEAVEILKKWNTGKWKMVKR